MPQCPAEHVIKGVVWYCVQESDHVDKQPHEDDNGKRWPNTAVRN